jgi:hypothetical protein
MIKVLLHRLLGFGSFAGLSAGFPLVNESFQSAIGPQ